MARRIKRDFFTNDRGFTCFIKLEDTYGADISVVESSSDPLDKVWIFIKGGVLRDNATGSSAHLNVKQATEIRDGLTRWLKKQGTR